MPESDEGPLEVSGFRHVSPGHERIDEKALAGSRRVGGRFNPAGEFGAIYLSLDLETAVAELERRADRTGVEVDQLLPRLLLTVKVRLHDVLDLTDTEVRNLWGLTEEDLASDEHRGCRDVGRAARRAGYEAILFPSAAREIGRNLAVFLDRLAPESNLDVAEIREL